MEEIDIVEKYGIDIENDLIKEAFTHISYLAEVPEEKRTGTGESYQRLELLGDKVIDYVIVEYMYYNLHEQEGKMSSILANYVCRKAHYMYSIELGLDKYLRVGPNKYKVLSKNEHIVADLYEAFIGAVSVLYGLEKAKEIIYDVAISKIKTGTSEEYLQDYKTQILTVYREKKFKYEIIGEEILEDNIIIYTSRVIDENGVEYGRGQGKKKKDAEQMAAKMAIEKKINENKVDEESERNINQENKD